MRWAELGLFLAPFILYAAWRLAAAWARPAVAWGALAAVGALMAATLWTGLSHRLDRDAIYVPAHMQDGRMVAGHGAPRAQP